MKHPLIDNKSTHYDHDGEPLIFKIERVLSVAAMAGAIEFKLMKYKHRLDHKGQRESDLRKIEHYTAYFDIIKSLLHKGHKKSTVSWAMEIEGIHFES